MFQMEQRINSRYDVGSDNGVINVSQELIPRGESLEIPLIFLMVLLSLGNCQNVKKKLFLKVYKTLGVLAQWS